MAFIKPSEELLLEEYHKIFRSDAARWAVTTGRFPQNLKTALSAFFYQWRYICLAARILLCYYASCQKDLFAFYIPLWLFPCGKYEHDCSGRRLGT